jgi:hypothetical protein
MPSLTQDTPPAVPELAADSTLLKSLFDAELKPFAAKRDDPFANVRKSVIIAAGECEQ